MRTATLDGDKPEADVITGLHTHDGLPRLGDTTRYAKRIRLGAYARTLTG